MKDQELHAVIYKGRDVDDWVAVCIEYDIATQGDSPEHALEMIKEAVELHFEDITPAEIEHVDNQVGSEPVIKTFSIRAPSLLKH